MRNKHVGGGLVSAAVMVMVMVAGCSSASPEDPAPAPSQSSSSPTREATSAPSAEASSPPAELVVGDAVATGTLVSPDNSLTGNVTVVVAAGGTFTLDFDSVTTTRDDSQMSPSLSARPFDEASYCDEPFQMLNYGNVDVTSNPSVLVWSDAINGENPSYLDDVVITQGNPGDTDPRSCYYPVVASAVLTWTLPDPRPDLLAVDSGETGGANGLAQTSNDILASYTVVDNDDIFEIAARFGLTIEDIFYLNPARLPNPELPLVQPGDVLNLSTITR